jgi:(2Fe-2S) ferredoxin
MATKDTSPYVCHVFVCTNDREGKAKSCADGKSPLVRSALKEEINQRDWKGKVRVSQSGCMGLCQHGPNVILYPQKIWLSGVSPDDLGQVMSSIEPILAISD